MGLGNGVGKRETGKEAELENDADVQGTGTAVAPETVFVGLEMGTGGGKVSLAVLGECTEELESGAAGQENVVGSGESVADLETDK